MFVCFALSGRKVPSSVELQNAGMRQSCQRAPGARKGVHCAMVRTFAALPLPVPVKQALADLLAKVRQSITGGLAARMNSCQPLAGWRFVSTANLHVTLCFLGDIPSERVSDVVTACEVAAGTMPPLSLAVSGTGAFPGWHRPSVIWSGLDGQVELLRRMVEGLETELAEAGFIAPRKPFQPHVTLARCRPNSALEVAQSIRVAGEQLRVPWLAEQVAVYRSILSPQGPSYVSMGCVELANAGKQKEGCESG